jgi:hypothetical protein
MKSYNQILKLITFLSLLTPCISHAEYNISIGAEDFKWSEASTTLKEQGNRYSLGVSTGTLLARPTGIFYEINANLYKGEVDYNISTPANPIKTTSSYSGNKIEGKIAVRLNHFDIAGTFGHEAWSREIKNSKTKLGKVILGSKEKFTQPYLKLGLGYFHYLKHDRARFEIGYKRPFEISKINDDLDLDLSPQGLDSVYLQYRYQSNNKWGVIIYSEKTHLGKSKSILINNKAVNQPESKTVALGAKFTYRF